MDVKPGQLEKWRERDWKLSKCGATEEWWISIGWIELQMKKACVYKLIKQWVNLEMIFYFEFSVKARAGGLML